jgi:hypothetical protein
MRFKVATCNHKIFKGVKTLPTEVLRADIRQFGKNADHKDAHFKVIIDH